MAKITLSFSYDDEKHPNIDAWLTSIPEGQRSREIRRAIRAHITNHEPTTQDLLDAIHDLKRELRTRTVVDATVEPEEDPDAIAALDALAAQF